ncbi:hypothetical protein GMO_24990 [Gluconobacter morbifer G707]|uniref:Glycosyltransferase n=2 Tax=Gluconobacter TaxID=441 RepID=G6XL76_9PROT|nr:glycosyltransferase family 2 protein [Gluconobacter morbifer]EHH67504.1 hypothetical protein GMO_24990 [Gluconobacter morbifer G707]
MTSLPSVAIVLFVKNEFSDIAGWIAWHRALGVKTLFIFDDHSSDGTWEIIQSAAAVCDIRAFRTDPVRQPDFYLRQRDSFMAAAEMCKGQYDWLGFLDGDEYVYLRHHNTLPAFLSGFDHADAVGLSWRIQGSSERVVRPKVTSVEAFLQHSTPELGDNRLIKSFVRPEKLGPTYYNPHWYDIPPERYVRPDGRPVNGQDANQEIDWNDAFVMHYICRSMEHYIQRIKRRLNADLGDSIIYWKHFDRNDATDHEPLRFISAVHVLLKDIYHVMVERAISALRNTWDKLEDTLVTRPEQEKPPTVYRLRTHFETFLYLLPHERRVVHCTHETAEQNSLLPLYAAIHGCTPGVMTLFTALQGEPDARHLLRLRNDDRLSDTLIYVLRSMEEHRYAAYNPVTNLHIAFVPNPNPGQPQGIERVVADRREIRDWEQFELVPDETVSYWSDRAPLTFNPNTKTTADQILIWLVEASIAPRADEFLRVLACVPVSVREEISRRVPGLLWTFV